MKSKKFFMYTHRPAVYAQPCCIHVALHNMFFLQFVNLLVVKLSGFLHFVIIFLIILIHYFFSLVLKERSQGSQNVLHYIFEFLSLTSTHTLCSYLCKSKQELFVYVLVTLLCVIPKYIFWSLLFFLLCHEMLCLCLILILMPGSHSWCCIHHALCDTLLNPAGRRITVMWKLWYLNLILGRLNIYTYVYRDSVYIYFIICNVCFRYVDPF